MANSHDESPPAAEVLTPLRPLTTALDWDDLVLDDAARKELDDIVAWARHESTLMNDWGLGRHIKPGLRCFFYGPPGTGKTLAAALIGKALGRPIHRVSLHAILSSPGADTGSTLDRLFNTAMANGWILLFDEADALSGRRAEPRDANDRFANQQIAYLLQRLEDFAGLIVVISNLDSALDEAFARRFQSAVHFPIPAPAERLRLWQDLMKDKPTLPDFDLRKLAAEHELTGGAIVEAVRYASLQAVAREPRAIGHADIKEGMKRGRQQTVMA